MSLAVQPVVMAGGSGTRLWPLSRAGFPKQFLVLSGRTSLFQQAVARLGGLAGAGSVLVPWPLASKPTASMAASTIGWPRICSIWSPSEALCEMSTVSNPTFFACASRSWLRSPRMTTAAPSRRALAAAASPTGPAPATYTVEPTPTPAVTAPWKPVGRMSESMVRSVIFSMAWSRSGNLSRLKSA
jgi:hypothetical protein